MGLAYFFYFESGGEVGSPRNSPVDFFAMSDIHHKDKWNFLVYLIDNPVVCYSNPIESFSAL